MTNICTAILHPTEAKLFIQLAAFAILYPSLANSHMTQTRAVSDPVLARAKHCKKKKEQARLNLEKISSSPPAFKRNSHKVIDLKMIRFNTDLSLVRQRKATFLKD